MTDPASAKREALKALRAQGGARLEAAQARLKEQNRITKELIARLKEGPQTVPALAAATGLPTETVFWYLMAFKKYGKLAEGEQDGDYLQYVLIGDQE